MLSFYDFVAALDGPCDGNYLAWIAWGMGLVDSEILTQRHFLSITGG